jgi:NAD(P)-dependent dehydrogenase (short-subunit alcohol dehydrogenase family)
MTSKQKEDLLQGMTRMPGPGDFGAEPPQRRPEGVGLQHEMKAKPISDQIANEAQFQDEFPVLDEYTPANKLRGRKALITGGDSGIGRAVAVFYAKEGADVAINYLPIEQKDAEETKQLVEKEGRKCHLIPLDIQSEAHCKEIIDSTISALGGIDIIVSNAAYQILQEDLQHLSEEQVERTFRTNVFPSIFLTKHAMPHFRKGSNVIITTSVVAYKGHEQLIDYASSKAAQVGLIRSLSQMLAPKGIRVNGVAPGPVWTPLQPIGRTAEDMVEFGNSKPPLGRAAQPSEMAPTYVFLASSEASQFTGQVLHPNGGYVING